MANRGDLMLFINHCGHFLKIGNTFEYYGLELTERHGFDKDRFGYFDLLEVVQTLGYTKGEKLYYRAYGSRKFVHMHNDEGVMEMLSKMQPGKHFVQVYVDSGSTNEKEVCHDNEGRTDDKQKGKAAVKPKVADKQKGKAVVQPKVADKQKDKSDVQEEADKQKGKSDVQPKVADVTVIEEDLDQLIDNFHEESTDEEYIPEEESSESDGLSGDELGTDDEEYFEARRRRAASKVADKETENFAFSSETGIQSMREDQSDYADSEEEVYSDSSSSGGFSGDDGVSHKKNKKKMIMYDAKVDHKHFKFELGMRFESVTQIRNAIQEYSIYNGHNIQIWRQTHSQIEAKCIESCPWKLYASTVKAEGRLAIKTLISDHKCSRDMRTKQASSKWIAKEYLQTFRRKPKMKIGDLEEMILQKYAVQPSKWKLYRGKYKALQMLRGTEEEHYSCLRSYVAELLRVDREGRFEFLLDEGTVFKGFFVGFSALKKGFLSGCRPIVGLDGAFLKTVIGGCLLTAVGKDANNQIYPIAWAVVDSENEANCKWFLNILFEEFGIRDGMGWTFISDQQKGLNNAVKDLGPLAEHKNCARHIYMNWKKEHKGQTLKNMFWRTVHCTYLAAYKESLEEMKAECPKAYNKFMEQDNFRFCKALISVHPKSDMVLNNVCETFNSTIVRARKKPIVEMLEMIRTYVMERQVEKLNMGSGLTDSICPRIRKKLEETKYKSRLCVTKPALGNKYQVTCFEDQFVVDLGDMSCTCRQWDISGIPCIHACSAIHWLKKDATDFVSPVYSCERLISSYSFPIEPLNGKRMWPEASGYPIKPPPFRRMPGRPKISRKKAPEEEAKTSTRLKRFGLQMTCQRCFQVGHNKKTCTNDPTPKPSKRPRGRPRLMTESRQAGGSEPIAKRPRGRPRIMRENTEAGGSEPIAKRSRGTPTEETEQSGVTRVTSHALVARKKKALMLRQNRVQKQSQNKESVEAVGTQESVAKI